MAPFSAPTGARNDEHEPVHSCRPRQIALHWLSVALMCSLVLAGELRHLLVEHADMRMRPIMIVHIGSGMALLVVMLMRSALRARPRQAHRRDHPAAVGECLAGWVIVNAKGLVIPMPGTWDFPRLVDADPQLVRYMVQAHEWLGFLLYALLAAHRRRAVASLVVRTARCPWAVRGAWRDADSACRTRPERRPGTGARGLRKSGIRVEFAPALVPVD